MTHYELLAACKRLTNIHPDTAADLQAVLSVLNHYENPTTRHLMVEQLARLMAVFIDSGHYVPASATVQ